MKLNLFLVSAVVAKPKTGLTGPKEKEKGNEGRYSWSTDAETCEATFSKYYEEYGSVLDIGNSGTSGYIDMHEYPNYCNCFIEVEADSNCLEITAQVQSSKNFDFQSRKVEKSKGRSTSTSTFFWSYFFLTLL